jgi:putative transcriptional regulator
MPLFRTRLNVLRAEREWSQAKLAAQVGVTPQTINCIEKGRFHDFTPTCVWPSKLPAPLGSRSRKSLSMRIFDRPTLCIEVA